MGASARKRRPPAIILHRCRAAWRFTEGWTLLLGFDRDVLPGRALASHLAPHSSRALQEALTRIARGGGREACTLVLLAPQGTELAVHAAVVADPGGRRFLIAFLDTGSPVS